MRAQHGQVLLRSPRQQRGHKADPHAPAQVPHQRRKPAHLVVFLLRNSRVAQRIDGNEQERQPLFQPPE